MSAVSTPTKPLMRGVLHQFGAAAAVAAGAVLVAFAPQGRPTVAVSVFAASLATLFAVSATYHRIDWSVAARAWMRRADHASIFVLIAGTYTPIAMLGLPRDTANALLLRVWIGALLGVLKALFWSRAPRAVVAILAVVVGWAIVPCIGEVRASYGAGTLALILGGGVAYSVGAIAYATKRPALWPTRFGYHELFHALTLVGAAMHFAAILTMVRALQR